ncbi:Cyclin-dependent kinase inhibitor 1B [Triplophysa tibetana]|uniref:Cyclin-dependent kinase inhibitor 1B n=1 Tax=Triplophysa tibetana TaxID=1572043 RepID=A0A5A9PGN0_9TELE|nr:Cyclin-dependent kinase inhibitor 1B [Triplophysa tibetana]
MSKVRVSNGSPPLDRVDARQPDSTRPPVCRNLFGSADREEDARDVREQMREIEEASKEKWNFDFANNEPLASGKYEWQEVDGKDLPDFYTRSHHVKRATSTGTVDHNGNHDYLLPTSSLENGQGESENSETGSESDCRTALTTPRKRPSTEDQDPPCQSKRPNVQTTEANRCPDSTHSVEQAPSKSDPKT